jgi:hypothetical protein
MVVMLSMMTASMNAQFTGHRHPGISRFQTLVIRANMEGLRRAPYS